MIIEPIWPNLGGLNAVISGQNNLKDINEAEFVLVQNMVDASQAAAQANSSESPANSPAIDSKNRYVHILGRNRFDSPGVLKVQLDNVNNWDHSLVANHRVLLVSPNDQGLILKKHKHEKICATNGRATVGNSPNAAFKNGATGSTGIFVTKITNPSSFRTNSGLQIKY